MFNKISLSFFFLGGYGWGDRMLIKFRGTIKCDGRTWAHPHGTFVPKSNKV